MKSWFYYARDAKNRPVITVCLLQNEVALSRGVSVCSPKDIPCKKAGRAIAKQRAIFAIENQTTRSRVKREEAINQFLNSMNGVFSFKIAYKPELTMREQRMVCDEKLCV